MNIFRTISFIIIMGGIYAPTAFGMQKYKKIIARRYTKTYNKQNFLKPEYKAVYPFLNSKKIKDITDWMDTIEQQKLSFDNYDGRIGISWDDFIIKTEPKTEVIKLCHDYPIVIEIDGKKEYPKVQSIFSNPIITDILCESIIPEALSELQEWMIKIPQTLLMRSELHRYRMHKNMNNQDNRINWHQDPGTLYKRKSNYTMIFLLSDQFDKTFGWHGGEFLVKKGKPTDTQPSTTTLMPRYNQALFINNRRYSHAVKAIIAKYEEVKRDIFILEAYTENEPLQQIIEE